MANREIWVYAELKGDTPVPVFYELLAKADEIARSKEWKVASVVIGSETADAVEMLQNCCDKVYVADSVELENYTLERYAAAMEALINEHQPEMVLVGATGIGSELAPTTAAKVKTGLAAHCIDIVVDEERDRINCMVPAFGGKVVSEIYIPEAKPMMASIRQGILEKAPVDRACAETVTLDTAFLAALPVRERFLEFTPEIIDGVKLEEANVVVAAGRGISTEASWATVNELADKLGAGVGWSRNFVDLGIVDTEANMIGTSGKSVKPSVFIGAGISGATHFVCGMLKSKMIISVNKDEKAKIFDYSDYGIVGDAGKFLASLAELL